MHHAHEKAKNNKIIALVDFYPRYTIQKDGKLQNIQNH